MAYIAKITDLEGSTYDLRSKITNGILYGECDSTSTATAFTVQIPGVTEYYDGLTIALRNNVVTSASGFTINVNGLGGKPSYSNMATGATPTRDTTIFNIAYTMIFVYSSTLVSGGAWIGYRGYDANTNTIGYQLRTNSSTMPMKQITYRYRLLFTSADGQGWVPANTSTSTNATAKRTVNQAKIDPFGEIVYYGTTASVAAGSNPAAASLWQEYTLSLGYSFNDTGAALVLPYPKPIYIKAAPQSDGSAIIDATTPYVLALPNSEDGNIYIYLGRTYSATSIELTMNHPVYYYKDGCVRPWTNAVVGEKELPDNLRGGYLHSWGPLNVIPSGTELRVDEERDSIDAGYSNSALLNGSFYYEGLHFGDRVDVTINGNVYRCYYEFDDYELVLKNNSNIGFIDKTDECLIAGLSPGTYSISAELVTDPEWFPFQGEVIELNSHDSYEVIDDLTQDLLTTYMAGDFLTHSFDHSHQSSNIYEHWLLYDDKWFNITLEGVGAFRLNADDATLYPFTKIITGDSVNRKGEFSFVYTYNGIPFSIRTEMWMNADDPAYNFNNVGWTFHIQQILTSNDTSPIAALNTAVAGKADSSDIPTNTSDLTNDSGFITGMTILSYGSSTWNDFITAYTAKKVVYCRASSNSNPASGSQTRLAFMAYVNNAENPTEVEFQYYRSVNTHTSSQQGDQVYVYKLTSSGSWTVTAREAMSKIVAGTGLSLSYTTDTITLNNTVTGLPAVTSSDNGKVLMVVNGAWAAETIPSAQGVSF